MSLQRNIPTQDRPDFKLYSNGNEVPRSINVLFLEVEHEFNRISSARVVLADGIPAEESYPISSGDLFVPGNEIAIKLGYGDELEEVFKGVVVKQKIRSKNESSILELTCKHKAFRMASSEKFAVFKDLKDAEIIEQIASNYGIRLSAQSTSINHQNMVQYNSTDWDFIVNRAEANGHVVVSGGDELETTAPEVKENADLELLLGATILDVETELDGRTQEETLLARGWDYKNQEAVEYEAEEADLSSAGNLNPSDLAQQLELNKEQSHYSAINTQEEAELTAKAEQTRRRLSKIRGTVSCKGNNAIVTGGTVKLGGLGDRFNGNALVSGISHVLKDGTWVMSLQIGTRPTSHLEEFKPMPKSAFNIPRAQGLEVGIVLDLDDDNDGEFRVKLRLPVFQDEEGIWARVAQTYAGDNYSVFFRPEIGDEVIVGFVNNDPRMPIILGGVHSSAKPSPIEQNSDNHIKGIVTRSGMKLLFDDEKSSVTIETPNGNKIVLTDDEGQIAIEDENGNTATLNSDGISFESGSNISIKATGDIKIEGTNVELTANAQLTAEGTAGAELSSSGVATIKGSLVQIN